VSTPERLAAALRAAGAPVAGYYDDFLSELTFPIRRLVDDARGAGLHTIAHRAMDGEFDATPDEAAAWAESAAGRAAFGAVVKRP
jgi:hypothetical protein